MVACATTLTFSLSLNKGCTESLSSALYSSKIAMREYSDILVRGVVVVVHKISNEGFAFCYVYITQLFNDTSDILHTLSWNLDCSLLFFFYRRQCQASYQQGIA